MCEQVCVCVCVCVNEPISHVYFNLFLSIIPGLCQGSRGDGVTSRSRSSLSLFRFTTAVPRTRVSLALTPCREEQRVHLAG